MSKILVDKETGEEYLELWRHTMEVDTVVLRPGEIVFRKLPMSEEDLNMRINRRLWAKNLGGLEKREEIILESLRTELQKKK